MHDTIQSKRVALVTGGARGIGRAISLELAKNGFCVVVNYERSEQAAVDLLDEIVRSGGQAHMFRADVADWNAVSRMFQSITEDFGRLDVLVNNAGVLHESLFALTKLEDFWTILNTNLGGVVNCSKIAIPLLMRERKGRIINIASIAAMHCSVGLSAYATSKAAIIALSKVLARELAPSGVTVNVVAPGLVDTEMARNRRNGTVRSQPIPRMGTPEEIAAVVTFLATEAPAYLTGEVIKVDGGAAIG
ncbi:MAG: 3-oxoacyl-ACP reductase FabG [Polyangiaceae bacterium]|nr:3-oxoacyl-ACP reductase FabG [Polyangiaceae bacterium]